MPEHPKNRVQNTEAIGEEESEYYQWVFEMIYTGHAAVMSVKERGSENYARLIVLTDENEDGVKVCPVARLDSQKTYLDLYEPPVEGTPMTLNEDGEEEEYQG